jgi:hypothetical protein
MKTTLEFTEEEVLQIVQQHLRKDGYKVVESEVLVKSEKRSDAFDREHWSVAVFNGMRFVVEKPPFVKGD